MQIAKVVLGVLAALGLSAAQAAVTPTVDLTGLGYVTYGDANSYSLAVGNYFACGKEMGQGCPYSVSGTPGASNQDPRVYIVQGANGAANNGLANVDDAFDAVNNTLFFTMTSANEPGSNGSKSATFAGDQANTWDATLGALNTKLDLLKNRLTFFFVNNEPNSKDGAAQNLAVWARVTLTSLSGNLIGTWDATNDSRTQAQRLAGTPQAPGYGPPPVGGGVPLGDVTKYTSEVNSPERTDYIMAGGQVCVDKTTKELVNCKTAAAGTFDTINHNLGENQAPYAILFPELNAAIDTLMASPSANLDQYVLHVDLRYGCAAPFTITGSGGNAACENYNGISGMAISQDNNFEQVFIGASPFAQNVPEPTSLLLVGAALVGVGAVRRNAKR